MHPCGQKNDLAETLFSLLGVNVHDGSIAVGLFDLNSVF